MKKALWILLLLAMLLSSALFISTSVKAEGTATIWTDKADYSSGEAVIIYGSGFNPEALVSITVTRPDGNSDVWTVTSDSFGSFSTTYLLNGITGTYTVTTTDGTNTATTTFTDANVGSVSVGTQSPDPVTAGNPATYTITVTKSGSGALPNVVLSVTTTLPTGASASFVPASVSFASGETSKTSTLTITTTSSTPAGSHSFTVKAEKTSIDYETGDGALHVQAVNHAPVLGSIGDKTVNELVTLSFTATATDIDVPPQTLTYSLIGAPAGASINSATGAFTWTPTELQGPGVYTFTVRATDNGVPSLYDDETFTVHVNEVNLAPTLTLPILPASVDEMVAWTFDADATDPDLPPNTLTFSLIDAPAGAVINPSTGVFTWTPTEAQGPGVYTFTVRATDDGSPNLYDEEEITVTVNEVNLPPVLDPIGNKNVDEETELTFIATASDPDLPANTLTYSLEGTVPSGASINSATGAFSWTPTEAQGPGDYTFKVRVTDDGTPSLYDEEEITVTVNEVNLPPELGAIGDKTVDEETALSFTATVSDPDLPPNTLTFSLIGAPAGASIDASTGAFSWTPSEAQGPGSYTFTVRITDDGSPAMYDEEEIDVTVNEVNVAPILGTISGKTVDELTLLTFTATATDADLPEQSLSFSLSDGLGGSVPLGASITSGGIFTWTPAEDQGPGDYTFDVVVSDGSLPDSETITVHVNEVNLPPVLGAIGDMTVDELTLLTFTATATDPDIPVQTLTFSLAGSVPAGASITSAGVFSWTPSEAQGPGSYTFDVVVSDGVATDFETITVTVNEVNLAPTVNAISDTSVDEMTLFSFTATATDPDTPANTLTFSLVGADHGASITSGGVFSWTPSEDQGPGDYTFMVRVTDDGSPSLYDDEEFSVHVNEVNLPPVLDAIGDKSVDELTLLTFTATATDPDLPPNTLTFSLVGAPSGTSIDPSTGAFSWTPSEAQGPGDYTFDAVVSDGLLEDSETITVHVNEVNRPPVLGSIGDKSTPWGEALTFTVTASDADVPANTLTFSLVGAPSGASIDGSSGAFSWTPTSGQIGSHTFTVRVTDNGSPNLYDEEEIKVTVGKRATTLVYSGDASEQYSDAATVTATLTDSLSGNGLGSKTITFTIGSQSNTAPTDGSGVATTSITLTQPAGSYTVESVFAEDDLYLASSDSDPFTINKETVTITYTGDTMVWTAGPTISSAPVRLSASLTQESDGYPGDLTLAKVRFVLVPVGGGASITVPNVVVNSLGEALTTVNVPVGNWFITVTIETANQYWTQSEAGMGTLTVDSGAGSRMVTGGGWIPDAQSANGKGNFGFTVNYQKKANPKGNFMYLFRGTDGYNYLIKSNSWQDGGLSFTSTNTAFFTGRCTIQKINRATGLVEASWGNYRFTVEIKDDGQRTPKADTFALKVWDPTSGTIWKQIGPSILGGGNIVVHSK